MSIHDKNSLRRGAEGTHLNIIKANNDEATANTLNGEQPKALPLRLETRQGCPVSPLSCSPVLEDLVRPNKETKGFYLKK